MLTRTVKHLLKFRSLLLILLVSAAFSSCTKSSFKWLYYDETYCADKWEFNINNERLKENVVSHLDKKGIKVFEIEIFSDQSPEACTSCTCKSGRRIKCKVKKRDVNDLKSEGFY